MDGGFGMESRGTQPIPRKDTLRIATFVVILALFPYPLGLLLALGIPLGWVYPVVYVGWVAFALFLGWLGLGRWSKNLLASTGLRQRRAEMVAQFVRDLAGEASDRKEVFRVRVREVFRGLETRIDESLRAHLADPLDPGQLLEEARRGRLRGMQFEDASLDPLVPGAVLEGLRVRPKGVVVSPHLHEHIALRGPRLLVVRIELGQAVVRIEGRFQFSEFLEDVPAVQHGRRVVRLHAEDKVEAVQGFLGLPAPPIRDRFADERVHVGRLDLEDVVEQAEGLRVVPARARDERPTQEARDVDASLLDLLFEVFVLGIERGSLLVRREGLRTATQVRQGVSLQLDRRGLARPHPEEFARGLEALPPSAVVRVESDDGPQGREVLLIPSEDPPVRGQGLLLPIEPNEAPRSTLERGEVTRIEAERLFVRRERGLVR